MARYSFPLLSFSLLSVACLDSQTPDVDPVGEDGALLDSGDDSSAGGDNEHAGSEDGVQGDGGGTELDDTGVGSDDSEPGDTGEGSDAGAEDTPVVVAHTGLAKALPPNGSSGMLTMMSDSVVAGRIADVNVSIDLDHTCTKDLSAVLKSPSETSVVLFELGSLPVCSSDLENTVLDDEAFLLISHGSSPFTGPHQPTGSLASFDGEDAAGVWTLSITDDTMGDVGTLESWSIELRLD